MFFTDRNKKRHFISNGKIIVALFLFLLIASCSGGGDSKNSDGSKESAEKIVDKKGAMISKSIEHLIALQNRVNTFKRKHGTLPDMDTFALGYDMWKGKIEFSMLKNNASYDYMLHSKGPDGKKNTDDDLRIINNLTENKTIKKTISESSSSDTLVDQLGGGDDPVIMSIDDLPTENLDGGGVELSLEDFQKMADDK